MDAIRYWFRAPIAMMAVLLALTEVALAQAPDLSEADVRAKELAAIESRIQSMKRSVGSVDRQRNSLSDQLAVLEMEYGRLANSMNELATQSDLAEKELTRLRERKSAIASKVLAQNKALIGQARTAYAQGQKEWLKVLLSRQDGGGSSRVLTYYRYLNGARVKQLHLLDADLAELKSLENAATTLTERLASAAETQKAEKARLDELKAERKQQLAALERESRDKNTELLKLREDAQKLQTLVVSLQKNSPPTQAAAVSEATPPATAGKSRTDWPVAGELRQHFGAPRMSTQWDGVVIAADEGRPVRAIKDGRVAFADWLRGYGLLAIVDHGNGLMSLYGFNQSVRKSVGEWVNAGEIVATVGSSGGQAEPALYFGLRDKGRPLDPLAWRSRDD